MIKLRSVLVLDPAVCDGCRACEVACSLKHERECNPMSSRIRVIREPTKGINTPLTCVHCEKPICKDVCPVKAIDIDYDTGLVRSPDKIRCIGCKLCLYICPISAPIFSSENGIVIKCDLCDGDPACVKFCSRKAIQYIPISKLDSINKRAKAKKLEEFQTKLKTGSVV